jgi:N-acyl-D-aspartate/D-glutamate deacylase
VNVAEYYQQIESGGAGVNVAHLFPQGALRDKVMGKVRRPPTDKELAKMEALTDQAMREGAWGMTTGLQYVPSSYADTDEIVQIAKMVSQHGGIYASHMRDEGDELLESIDETIEIGRRAELPVHISHLKSSKRRNWGKVRAAAKRIESARAEGLIVTADQYPYNASSTSVAAMLLPDEEREGGEQATIDRLKSAEHGPRLRQLVADGLEGRGPIMIAEIDGHPAWVGKMLTEIAEAENRPLIDIAWEVLLTGNVSGVSFSMDENDVRYAMTLPFVATASDGSSKIDDGTKPHPRSFGTFPRKIGRYAIGEGVVPLEFAVRSSTGLPADILGLADRGYLRPGQKADVVVFDPKKFNDRATFQSPFETSEGIRWVLVNGRAVIVDGQFQNQLAGRALRKE